MLEDRSEVMKSKLCGAKSASSRDVSITGGFNAHISMSASGKAPTVRSHARRTGRNQRFHAFPGPVPMSQRDHPRTELDQPLGRRVSSAK